jgi:hypothetical protein
VHKQHRTAAGASAMPADRCPITGDNFDNRTVTERPFVLGPAGRSSLGRSAFVRLRAPVARARSSARAGDESPLPA